MFAPGVCWSFVATGLYVWQHRPESRIGALMVALGFAWLLFCLQAADSPVVYAIGVVTGGLWGSLFLHIGLSFPTGRLRRRRDRALVLRRLRDLPAGVRARAAVRRRAGAGRRRATCC